MKAHNNNEMPQKPQKSTYVPVDNNYLLYEQICELLINDYYDRQLSKTQSGSIEFFVRHGQVAINFYEKTASLVRGKNLKPATKGMSKNGLKYFLMLLEDTFEEMDPVDYGYLYITYNVDEAGNLVNGEIWLKEEVHHHRQ